MTARMAEIPSPEELRESFKRKGTDISLGEAQELVVAVEKHRADQGVPPSAKRAATSGKAKSKPETKDELRAIADRVSRLEDKSAPAVKTERHSYGG